MHVCFCAIQGCNFHKIFHNLVRLQNGLTTCHSKRMARWKSLLSRPLLQVIAIPWHAWRSLAHWSTALQR